jgi:hypothetical protein
MAVRKGRRPKKAAPESEFYDPCCDHQITDPALLTTPNLEKKLVSDDGPPLGKYTSDVRGNLGTGCGPLTAALARVCRTGDPIPRDPPNPPATDTPHTMTNTSHYFSKVHGAEKSQTNLLVVWTRCGATGGWVRETRKFEGT